MNGHTHPTNHGHVEALTKDEALAAANGQNGRIVVMLVILRMVEEYGRWVGLGAKERYGDRTVTHNGRAIPAADFATAKLKLIAADPVGFMQGMTNNVTAMLAGRGMAVDPLALTLPFLRALERDLATYPTPGHRIVEGGTVTVSDTPDTKGRVLLTYPAQNGKTRTVKMAGLFRSVTTVYGPVIDLAESAAMLLAGHVGGTAVHDGHDLAPKARTFKPGRWLADNKRLAYNIGRSTQKAWRNVEGGPLVQAVADVMLDVDGLATMIAERPYWDSFPTIDDYLD